MRSAPVCAWLFMVVGLSCAGDGGKNLNRTSVTCPEGRTFLDGVCVAEAVADYVACVRAQGAQLGGDRSEKLSAEASALGARAGGAAEVSERLEKKYSASDQAMLAIIQACNDTTGANAGRRASGKSLMGHWTFDEAGGNGAADATGHGNTGVLSGAGSWVSGRLGGALKLDGQGEILVNDDASHHAPQAITLAGWFLMTQGGMPLPWREIFIKSNPKGGNWWGCIEGEDPSPCDGREYGLSINNADRFALVYATTEDRFQNGGQTHCATPPGSVQFGKWHHVAAIISSRGRSMRIFLDGALMATCPLSEAGMRRAAYPLHLGTNWVGLLDDLRIYAGELTDAEIATLAAATGR